MSDNECCATCRHRYKLQKYYFDKDGQFQSADMDGYACAAPELMYDGVITWMMTNRLEDDMCECYKPEDGWRDLVYYIAGPMSGLPDYGREHFNEVEAKLKADGCKVINPAILPTDLPDRVYMPMCLAMVREADVIVLLDGWRDSRGAQLEYDYAVRCNKRVLTEEYVFSEKWRDRIWRVTW